jgi:hypothetical protein
LDSGGFAYLGEAFGRVEVHDLGVVVDDGSGDGVQTGSRQFVYVGPLYCVWCRAFRR